MMVSAVIFDMDGLMVDTEPVYQRSWQRTAQDLGYEIDELLYERFVGRPTRVCEDILVEHFGPAFPLSAFQQGWPVLWRSEVERCGITLKPGLMEMLDYVAGRLPIAVATSSEAEYAELTLGLAGIRHRFQVVVSGDQVSRGKPAPDIYLEAARRLHIPASECVALEDSEAGIRAVQSAGMIGVLVPHWPASQEARQAATSVAASLHEARIILTSLIEHQRL